MNISTRILSTDDRYELALRKLVSLGVPNREINVLQAAPKGQSVGAAEAGDALFHIRGVGRVIASGDRAKSLLRVAGTKKNDSADLGEEPAAETMLDHFFVFEDALRRGERVLFVVAAEQHQWEKIEAAFGECGGTELHQAREEWWGRICETDEQATATYNAPHDVDDYLFRLGFEVALHPARRGSSFEDAREGLRATHPEACDTESFRKGYEHGRAHQKALDSAALCPTGSR